MHPKRDQAIEMRKAGASYREIRNATGITNGTLSYMLRDLKLSEEQNLRFKRPVIRKFEREQARREKQEAREAVRRQKADERLAKTNEKLKQPKACVWLDFGVRRYGPYQVKTGHLFWVYHYPNGKNNSVYLHREIMEKALNRSLTEEEVVHHINGDPTDNRLENLEVKSRSDHAYDHSLERPAEMVRIVCPECREEAYLYASVVKHNQNKQGKAGPFCSRTCAGHWSRKRQLENK